MYNYSIVLFLEKKMFNKSVGIDLGTDTVSVYVSGKGVILCEPSAIARDVAQSRVVASGAEAEAMIGRTPPQIEAVHPIRGGVISSFSRTDEMLKSLLDKARRSIGKSANVMMCVPSGITDVELRAVIESARAITSGDIYIIDKVMASAIGAGIDITKPEGVMVCDIGGGTSDIAVICAGHIVSGRSIKIAGDEFCTALSRYIRRTYNLNIGDATAEHIKKSIGTLYPKDDVSMVVKGLSTVSGLPESIVVTQAELTPAFWETAHNIRERIKEVLEDVSSRLQSDILAGGIVLAGGGALLDGLDRYIQEGTGVGAFVCDEPITASAKGAGEAFRYIDKGAEPTFGKFYKKAYIYK